MRMWRHLWRDCIFTLMFTWMSDVASFFKLFIDDVVVGRRADLNQDCCTVVTSLRFSGAKIVSSVSNFVSQYPYFRRVRIQHAICTFSVKYVTLSPRYVTLLALVCCLRMSEQSIQIPNIVLSSSRSGRMSALTSRCWRHSTYITSVRRKRVMFLWWKFLRCFLTSVEHLWSLFILLYFPVFSSITYISPVHF